MAYEDLGDVLTPIEDKLDELIALGWATPSDKADILTQRDYLDLNRTAIEALYPDMWVAISNSTAYAADSREGAEQLATGANPTRPFWVEPIPYRAAALNIQDN